MKYNRANPKTVKQSPRIENYSLISNQNSENIFDNENQGQSNKDKVISSFDEFLEKKFDEDNFLQKKTLRSYNSEDEQISLDNMSMSDINLSDKHGKLNQEFLDNNNNLFCMNPNIKNINLNITTKAQTKNIINFEKKISRNDNLRKEIMKIPANIVRHIIEKIINAKLSINLDEIFGFNYRQNRAALNLKIYEILCFKLDNKIILENAKPNKEDEKIFLYLLTRTYEFIYENYINNNRIFKIGEDYIEIKEFKIFDDIIRERYDKSGKELVDISETRNKSKKYGEKDMNEFIKTSKDYFKKLKNGLFEERTPKKVKFFVLRIIDKFEDYINNENKFV
jgi:hypothetical protein